MRLHLIEEISLTDVGMKRRHNEDAIGDVQLLSHLTGKPENLVKRGRLYAVADGMGGYVGGEIASHLALQALFLTYYSLQGHPLDDFKKAVLAANQAVYQAGNNDNPMQSSSGAAALDRQFSPKATQPENHTSGSSQEDVYEADSQHHMGTTLTAALLVENTLYTANVGDSRIYLLRKGKLSQLTRDHSVVGEGVRQGLFTKGQARSSPFNNVITRALGQHPQVEPISPK